MSNHAEDAKFTLKVLLDKQKTKVLFAEVDSDFADVLISFMALPLGSIVKILKKHYGEEALRTFWTEGCKEILVNPKSSFGAECRKLKLDISDTQPTEYFICSNLLKYDCEGHNLLLRCSSVYYDTATCFCQRIMKRKADENDEYSSRAATDGGVFTLKATSFIISDDLQIFPNTKGLFQTLGDFAISDVDLVEPINVTFGFSEIMDLLKGSLFSRTPLSDIILKKRSHVEFVSTSSESEQEILSRNLEKEETSNSKKMVLKVVLQKSTNKILFAQSDEGFVDFLCSLLAIPLGGAECLLGGKSRLTSVDNIYNSIADIHNNYLVCGGNMKDRLMKPKLPHGYITKNPILPITEEDYSRTECYPSFGTIIFDSVKFSREQGEYMRGSKMYKITDDLTVTPLCMTAIISDLKELKIPLSDIKELELEIRSDEALRILRASLTSTSALSDALINDSMLNKQCM
ncbi:hypothetical protein ABFS83_13G017900 [Erythranthe nasuta]